LPGRPGSHVDDRHVDAADVADQVEALAAAGALVDLEALMQRFAHTEANQRVSVDHKAMWALGTQPLDPSRGGSGPCGRKKDVISITSKSRYEVVAMAELARSGERPVPIKEVAERRGMLEQFLEQLFSTLRRGGLLTS